MREEILSMIARCQNRIRGLQAETDLTAVGQRMAYSRILNDLKRLLELAPEEKKATIWMKFPDGEYAYGTYDYTTPGEKTWVNELANRIRHERFCNTEVRVE